MSNLGDDSELTILVNLDEDAKGVVQMLIFDREDGFPEVHENAVSKNTAKVENGKAIFNFENLPQGTYAVAAFHDGDADGKMRKTLLGIPKDAYGFSNDARSKFSAPSFESAAFELSTGKNTINFSLKL
ncbi:DUF2141 domain-containing protein [Cyclobacterium qasimii]|nr:DUF2141 domain-containing protein [Cyclobacterium qasimii]